jgi:hypothetical protein
MMCLRDWPTAATLPRFNASLVEAAKERYRRARIEHRSVLIELRSGIIAALFGLAILIAGLTWLPGPEVGQ